jgi:hypothetical protein
VDAKMVIQSKMSPEAIDDDRRETGDIFKSIIYHLQKHH